MKQIKYYVGAAGAALLLTACGGSSSDGDSETATTEASATETTTAEEATTDTEAPETATEPEAEDTGSADEAAGLEVGRTGPIRELPGLAEWADMDLKPFLMEVMQFPDEIPVPNNAQLTWVTIQQRFDEGASAHTSTATYEPMFSMEEFMTMVPEMVEGDTWNNPDISEDPEDGTSSFSYYAEDDSLAITELYLEYTNADGDEPAKLRVYTFGRYVSGPDLIAYDAFFPWVGEIVVDPAMVNDSVAYDLGRIEGRAEVNRYWSAPVTDFDRLTEFYRTPTGTGFTVDEEMEFDDSPWPTNEVGVVRDDGFDGSIEVYQTDPEEDVSVSVWGTYVLD